jgi:hypothetical protein
MPATTVTDLLQNLAHREPHRLTGAVLIVDESGVASNRQGTELLRLAERHSARVLFIGDTRQHSAIEAGDFLRVLETHSAIHRVELTSIRRQHLLYRDAVVSLAAGATRAGMEKLDALGWIARPMATYTSQPRLTKSRRCSALTPADLVTGSKNAPKRRCAVGKPMPISEARTPGALFASRSTRIFH